SARARARRRPCAPRLQAPLPLRKAPARRERGRPEPSGRCSSATASRCSACRRTPERASTWAPTDLTALLRRGPAARLQDGFQRNRGGTMRLAVNDWMFDSDTREVIRKGRAVPLSPKAFALLELLIRRRPKAVSKAEIRGQLWPGTFVSPANHDQISHDVAFNGGIVGAEGREEKHDNRRMPSFRPYQGKVLTFRGDDDCSNYYNDLLRDMAGEFSARGVV